MKTSTQESNKELQILTLENKEKADEFMKDLSSYEDYLMTRYADCITKGQVAVEIAQFRHEDKTHVICVESNSLAPVFEKGIEDSLENKDSLKAAKYMFLKQKLEKLKDNE